MSDTWYTLNEPTVHLSAGYVAGVLPPGRTNGRGLLSATINILRAHAASYHALHQKAAQAHHVIQVGIAHHLRVFDPANEENLVEQMAAGTVDYLWNWLFVDAVETGVVSPPLDALARFGLKLRLQKYMPDNARPIEFLKHSQDFIGVNYYTRDLIEFHFNQREWLSSFRRIVNPAARAGGKISDLNWEIYPFGLYRILRAAEARVQLKGQRSLPILISESGIADRSDVRQVGYIKAHLRAVARAIREKIPVTGFTYWTLIDNFEWNSGYFPRFGLYSVDLESLVRTARPSAAWFTKMVSENGFED